MQLMEVYNARQFGPAPPAVTQTPSSRVVLDQLWHSSVPHASSGCWATLSRIVRQQGSPQAVREAP